MTTVATVPGGLTVVMPAYNKGPHIARAIESVLHQTAGFGTLIVVDDGSADDGPEQVAAFRDSRIRLLRRSPPGPGGYAARNHGIAAADTEWIAFLDADDSWDPQFISAVASLIATHGDRIIGAATSYRMHDPSGEIRLQTFGASCPSAVTVLQLEDYLDAWLTFRESPLWTSAVAFRRSALIEAGLFPESRCRRGGDKDLWLRALMQGPVAFDRRPLATYFRDSINMVTASVKTTAAHCIVQTIANSLQRHPIPIQGKLKRLSNMETFSYSLSAARTGTLNASIYATFYHEYSDYRFYLITLLRLVPKRLRPFLGKVLQRWLAEPR